MESKFLFGHTVFLLCWVQFPAEKCQQSAVLSNDSSQMQLRTACVDLKALRVIKVDKGNKPSNSFLYNVECLLMDSIPVPWPFLCLISLCDIGVPTLTNLNIYWS